MIHAVGIARGGCATTTGATTGAGAAPGIGGGAGAYRVSAGGACFFGERASSNPVARSRQLVNREEGSLDNALSSTLITGAGIDACGSDFSNTIFCISRILEESSNGALPVRHLHAMAA